MAIQEQQVGSTGNIAEVKAASVLPVAATDGALVTMSRPDDPLLTALIADYTLVGAGGQLALNQNIILGTAGAGAFDATNFRSVALSIIPSAGTVTAGAITFEESNDGANWVAASFIDKAAPANAPISTYTIVASTPRFFCGKVLFKYFRARISTGITGTTTGVQCFSEFLGESSDFTIAPVRITDGTNVIPTMDAVARAGFQKITDGVSVQSVKAASTAAVAADLAAVVSLSPNLPVPTLHTFESLATTNATSVKASAGRITSLVLTSPLVTATVRFFKLYNKASAPTVGTDIPVMTIPFATVATNGGQVIITPDMLGIYFSTGIAYAITALSTTADTTAVGAGDVKVFINYI